MAKKLTFQFNGWQVDGVMYPPDKPPPEIVERIVNGFKVALKPRIRPQIKEAKS